MSQDESTPPAVHRGGVSYMVLGDGQLGLGDLPGAVGPSEEGRAIGRPAVHLIELEQQGARVPDTHRRGQRSTRHS